MANSHTHRGHSRRPQSRTLSVAELLHTDSLQAGSDGSDPAEESDAVLRSIPRAQQDSPSDARRRFFDPARDFGDYTPEVHALTNESAASPSTESDSSQGTTYKLQILQQPLAARACGHGERDRRVVDPPPIVQLTLDNFDPQSEDDQMAIQLPGNIVHCTLLSVPQGKDVSATKDPFHPEKLQRRLMGTQATSAFVGTDPNMPDSVPKELRLGVFFIFSDVSCRHTGRYRLKFDLMTLTAQPNDLGSQAMILASSVSDIFEVYNAKDFPGMKPSSDLARELRNQGANIPIKKGVDCVYGSGSKGKRRNRGNDSDEGMSDG